CFCREQGYGSLNSRTKNSPTKPGRFNPDSLAGMIKQAWCSALKVDRQQYATLAHFPQSPSSWLERGNVTQLQQALERASYLAKHHSKVTGDGERNFGCSRG
ncbi:inovirus-type Gp2 protein, partial [Serratia quinivorans]|uniref:YagK/YfjJ domain-containing protein n=1 Tax=Serratia quinivorans TaxID=137545 RepID=UPI002E79ECB6